MHSRRRSPSVSRGLLASTGTFLFSVGGRRVCLARKSAQTRMSAPDTVSSGVPGDPWGQLGFDFPARRVGMSADADPGPIAEQERHRPVAEDAARDLVQLAHT